MPDRAALVTGASSGIGLAIADVLGEEGHGLTVAARRPEKLADAVEELRGKGYEVEEVAANLTSEEEVQRVVAAHRERYGRLDVLVNSAGVGVGAAVADIADQARRHAARPQPARDRPVLPRVRGAAAGGRAPSIATRSWSTSRRSPGKSGPGVAVGLLGHRRRR